MTMDKTDTTFSKYRRYYQVLEPVLAKPKTRAYTMAIFSFLAVSLFGWYAIRPTIQTILYLRREITDKARINQQMEDKINALIEAEAAYQAAAPLLPLIGEAIPQAPDAVRVVLQLRNLTSALGSPLSGVQVPSTPILGAEASPGAKLQAPKLYDFPLTTILTGPYALTKSFLDETVSLRRIMSIESLKLVPSRDSGPTRTGTASGALLQLVLKLKAYYQ